MKKFTWEDFKKKSLIVKCNGYQVIEHFAKSAEKAGIDTTPIRRRMESYPSMILVACKTFGDGYIAEPTPMFMTNHSPWLVDWETDVIVPLGDKIDVIPKETSDMATKQEEPKKVSETAVPKSNKSSEVNSNGSANDAWDLMRKIALMSTRDVVLAFGKPYANPLLHFDYEEAKMRYDAWYSNMHSFQAKDVVFAPDGRKAIVVGKPFTDKESGIIFHEVLYGDFTTGKFPAKDLINTGHQVTNFS